MANPLAILGVVLLAIGGFLIVTSFQAVFQVSVLGLALIVVGFYLTFKLKIYSKL